MTARFTYLAGSDGPSRLLVSPNGQDEWEVALTPALANRLLDAVYAVLDAPEVGRLSQRSAAAGTSTDVPPIGDTNGTVTPFPSDGVRLRTRRLFGI